MDGWWSGGATRLASKLANFANLNSLEELRFSMPIKGGGVQLGGKGPAPGMGAKDASQRRRRNSPVPVTILSADGKLHGPNLPDTHEWPQATLDWWETWRASAQASQFTKTDWSFLIDTAVLHAEFWLGDRSVAAELRLRAAKFGATPEDRARLKISVGDPKKTAVPTRLRTKTATSRRERLLRAVGDGTERDAE